MVISNLKLASVQTGRHSLSDSLVDLALVSVALRSAVEAHGVDGDVGQLLRGNLHLEEKTKEENTDKRR